MIYAVLRPHRKVTGAFTLKIEPTETDAKVLGLSQEGPEELEMQSGFFLSDQDAINAVRAHLRSAIEIEDDQPDGEAKTYVVRQMATEI